MRMSYAYRDCTLYDSLQMLICVYVHLYSRTYVPYSY